MKRILALLLVSVVAAGGAYLYINARGAAPAPSAASSPIPGGMMSASAQDAAIDTSIVQEMSLGDPQAKVTMIEYASFTCPHCARFHEEVMPKLKKDYIDTGKVHFIFREVYFDRYGLWAGLVARCGGPLRYFAIVDRIFKTQREWTKGENASELVGNLRRIGKANGLTDEQLDACLSDGEKAQAMVALFQQNMEKDNIEGTPSFVINGRKYSNMSYEDMKAILDGLLKE